MGVPLLLTWLRSRFATCFHPANGNISNGITGTTDSLYIDLNSLLYHSANLVSLSGAQFDTADDIEAAVLRKLNDLLDDIVFRLVQPKALVYIAVDGVSPLGKMSQQRSRRRRQNHRRRAAGNMGSLWDTNCISVGTRFMARVTDVLHVYAVSRTERINAKRFQAAVQVGHTANAEPFAPISIIVDDVMRPGEGENKISEAIRRFRAQPAYHPDTSHVICSSDTDVTVSSLILHEPRIHVLRYEPPASLGSRDTSGQNGDAWLSTFFSIHIFREALRETLGLQRSSTDPAQGSTRQDTVFEHALHDVVFVMLLFGNDFLPSLGGSIKEGTLDALLALLATDFVSRGRTLVDPLTNHILFSSARYLLDCLADILGERNGTNGVLQVNGSGGALSWGFDDDPAFRARQLRREKVEEKKCYCYWTMLQWALQYSAGIVDHWGSYYPYSSSPPLHLLRKYCGVLSYEGLAQFAASRHVAHKNGGTSEEAMDTVEMTGVSTADNGNAAVTASSTINRGQPTDVMVQLLILIPPQSIHLLPTPLRHKYDEISVAVQAPVEELDMGAIRSWCERISRTLSKEELTRFKAYQFFASDAVLKSEDGSQSVPATDVTFMAYWPSSTYAKELEAAKVTKPVAAAAPAPPMATAASFFGVRRATPSAATAALVRTMAAAAPNPEADESETTAAEEAHRSLDVLRSASFTVTVGPCALLPDVSLVEAMGILHGNRFKVGSTNGSSSIADDVILSRSASGNNCIRLSWVLAAVPLVSDINCVASLLTGCTTPVEQTYQDKIEVQRQEQQSKADPWKRMAGKRGRSEEGAEGHR